MSCIDVVIVSFNVRDLLEGCLSSLRMHDGHELRVWVVDNASTDGTCEMVRNRFWDVRLLELSENVGFAAGINAALRNVDAEYVVLLNPDTVVPPRALETMVAFLAGHPRVGAVGPRLISPDGSAQTSYRRFPTLRSVARSLVLRDPVIALAVESPHPVDYVVGACIATRRDVLESVGLLDEGFFLYSEEVEWCWRVWRSGRQVWHLPSAVVTHVSGASAETRDGCEIVRGGLMLHHFYRSEFLYFMKTSGRRVALAAYMIRWLGLVVGVVKRTVKGDRSGACDRWRALGVLYSIGAFGLLRLHPRRNVRCGTDAGS